MTRTRLAWIALAGLVPAMCVAATYQFLEDPGEGDFDVTGALTVKDAGKLVAQIAFNYQEPSKQHYLLTIKQNVAKVLVVNGNQVRQIGETAALSLKSGATVPFTLQRRQWRMVLVLDNVVVLRGFDRALQDGKIGSACTGGTFAEVRVQPVGDMVAEDDFVREEGAESIWQPILGTWEARTLRDDPQAGREEGDKSANAFSYLGSGSPRAISVGGNWFWDRYSMESSVRPMGRGAVGVVLYYQDDKNYLLARWSSLADTGPGGNKLQLVARRQDKETVLAERAGGYEPGQWYKLRARVCDGIIQCLVDDELLLESQTALFGQGQIGLYVEGKAGVFFDDVSCQEWQLFRETFASVVPGKWRAPGWAQKNGVMTYAGKGRSLCATGDDWQRYTVALDVTPAAATGAGLAICYENPKTYCVLRVAPAKAQVPYAGKLQLVRFTEAGGSVLADQAVSLKGRRQTLRLSIEDGLLTGLLNDGPCLQAVVPEVTGGAMALYADGSATFDNVRLLLLPPRRGSHVTKEFTEVDKHPEMAEWASTKAPWVLPGEGKDDWWTKGDYFGDTSVTFRIPAVGSKTGTARATLGGEPGQKSGITLTAAVAEKSKQLQLTLAAADQELKQAQVEVEGDANIVFSREKQLVLVRVNDRPVLSVARP